MNSLGADRASRTPVVVPHVDFEPTGNAQIVARIGRSGLRPCWRTRGRAGGRGKDEAVFYLLACRECGDPERPLVMPFASAAERGKWAAEHTRATGHDRWWVKDQKEEAE